MNPFVQTLEPIWRSPTCVFVDQERIRETAVRFAQEALELPDWRMPVFPAEDDSTFINFLGVGNSINFAFTDFNTHQQFATEYKGASWKGAFAMWACIMRATEQRKETLRGRFLSSLDRKDFSQIFAGNIPIPLTEERLRALNEVGSILEKHYSGYFSNLFEDAQFTAFGERGIVTRLITEFPSFNDESLHRASGTVLKFHKRAQLLPMMYQGRAASSSLLPQIKDFADLGPIADYAVPRGLRNSGILEYTPGLAKMVDDRVLIPKDSTEEQEIRAQTENAQRQILRELERISHGPKPTMLHIDYKVWSLGRGAKEPHHLTQTIAY